MKTKKFKQTLEQLLEDLIQITGTIKIIYDNLISCILEENELEYQTNLNYLTMCLELENKLYQKINSSLTNAFKDYEAITEILEKKQTPQNDLLLERIMIYCASYHFLTPFLSSNEDDFLKQTENIITVLNQYNMDFIYKNFCLLEDNLSKLEDKKIKKQLLIEIYKKIFVSKIMEQFILLKQIPTIQMLGRERCLLFHQEESFVDKLYFKKSKMIIENNIRNLIHQNRTQSSFKILNLLEMEAALSLLTEEEIDIIYTTYYETYLKEKTFPRKKRQNEIIEVFKKVKKLSK